MVLLECTLKVFNVYPVSSVQSLARSAVADIAQNVSQMIPRWTHGHCQHCLMGADFYEKRQWLVHTATWTHESAMQAASQLLTNELDRSNTIQMPCGIFQQNVIGFQARYMQWLNQGSGWHG